jgi:hypothetical protein
MRFDIIADALNITHTAAMRRCLENGVDHLLEKGLAPAVAKRHRKEEELLSTIEKTR